MQANNSLTADVDIRVRVRGGGHTSQVYAIRQAIAKSIVSLLTSLHSTCATMIPPNDDNLAVFSQHRRQVTDKHIADRLLPKIHRRTQQEPTQASPRRLRPYPPRGRQQTVRAQEVRRSRCACSVPEVVQIRQERRDGSSRRLRFCIAGLQCRSVGAKASRRTAAAHIEC